MDASTLIALAATCAPQVNGSTASALVAIESGFNPHAIGVVGGALQRQPRSHSEAVVTAQALQRSGWNFSVGLSQINAGNFDRLGLTVESAFDPCRNLGAMQAVLAECFDRAQRREPSTQRSLRQALSCYYSGNFSTGFRDGYVQRVVRALPPGGTVSGVPP